MAIGDGGPHVQVAAICEKVLREASGGALSLINIVEGVTATAIGVDVPEEMPPLSLESLFLVITLWSDKTKGRYKLRIRPEAPSGIRDDPLEIPINFRETGNKGVDTVIPMGYTVTEEGLYWFDVLLGTNDQEGRLLTRIPLNVMYQPQALPR
jgi:hypothetical protein